MRSYRGTSRPVAAPMANLPPDVTSDPLPYVQLAPPQRRQRLKEIAFVFLKLGIVAFGGPAAHIAMMDDEVVKHRTWMSREKFLDLLGVTNLIPGPNSTELAIFIGYKYGGIFGLVLAGVSFILPAMLLVWGLAVVYVRYQTLPQLSWLLYGIKPVIIAILGQALWKLGQKAIQDVRTAIAALAVIIAFALGANELLLLVLAGLGVTLFENGIGPKGTKIPFLILPNLLVGATPVAVPSVSWVNVFFFFLKVGSVLYGSGYVLLAFLQRDLVERSQWLTSQQLLDAVAIGQVTPGPVFTTATFVGYLLAGHGGAIAGTLGIFLPSFILILAIGPWVAKLRSSVWASGFLDGVNAASLGLMAVATYTLGRAAIVDWLTLAVALLSSIAILRFQLNSVWLISIGGAVGIAAKIWGG
ncbi:chromate efflux transporter [Altericista sp. CCNU0014]|uniref:chromate efflux transporter n=1 Tax=Altericista sp. CCNU0014 TaxID=3082949 RepID=UPI00384EC145